jgi:hypothetical protein
MPDTVVPAMDGGVGIDWDWDWDWEDSQGWGGVYCWWWCC